MSVCITPEGVRLHFQSAGNGKPLLFLHGWAMCSRVWKYQLEWFAKRYYVMALDLRGHGRSEGAEGGYGLGLLTRDLIHFIEGQKLEKVTLIGWSLAVSLILKLLGTGVSGVDALVLISGTPCLVASPDFPHGLPLPVVKRMLRLVRSNFPKAMEEFHALLLSDEERAGNHQEEVRDLLANRSYLPQPEVAHRLLQEFVNEDVRDEIGNVTVPALLIQGGRDTICLPGAAYYMRERLTHAELTIFPDAGHAPFLTQADLFNQRVQNFLNSL